MSNKKMATRNDLKLGDDLQQLSDGKERTLRNYENYQKMCAALKDENRILKDIHDRDIVKEQKQYELGFKMENFCQKMDYVAALFENEKCGKRQIDKQTGCANFSENVYEEHRQLEGTAIPTCAIRNEDHLKVQELKEQSKTKSTVHREKFRDMVMHYEKLLQQTRNLNDQLRVDYTALESKMKALKNSVSNLQTELSSDINQDFNELRSSLLLNSGGYYPKARVLKFLYDQNKDGDDRVDFLGNLTGPSSKN